MLIKMASALADALFFRAARRERYELAHAQRVAIGANGVVVGAETIVMPHSGGRGVLLLHGFNDTPQSMAFLATALHREGWSVLVPRLAGHGVCLPRVASEMRAAAWRAEVSLAYSQLCAQHETVMVCGQSMGGALALLLADAHPELPALVLLAPYIGMPAKIQWQIAAAWLLHPFGPYRPGRGGDRSLHDPEAKAKALGPGVITARSMTALRTIAIAARAALPRIRVPTLYLQSREDNRIRVDVATHAFDELASAKKSQQWLNGCGHIISADYCKDEVAKQVLAWFAKHGGSPYADATARLASTSAPVVTDAG